MKDYTLYIESYLLGELEGPTLKDFEQALIEDPNLAHLVEQHRALQTQLLGMQLRQKVGVALKRTVPPKPLFRLEWILYAVILVALIAIGWWYFIFNTANINLKQTPFVQNPVQQPALSRDTLAPTNHIKKADEIINDAQPIKTSPPQNKSAKNVPRLFALADTYFVEPADRYVREAAGQKIDNSVLQKAAKAYSDHDYSLTCALLRSEASIEGSDDGRFLRASACFKSGFVKGAAKDFRQLEDSFKYKHEARWNLLLCEIAQGHANEPAIQAMLETMILDADYPYHEAAKKLKSAL